MARVAGFADWDYSTGDELACRMASAAVRLRHHDLSGHTAVRPVTVAAGWRLRPDSNVGLLTGARSGLVVLDVDPAAGGTGGLRQLQAGGRRPAAPHPVRPHRQRRRLLAPCYTPTQACRSRTAPAGTVPG